MDLYQKMEQSFYKNHSSWTSVSQAAAVACRNGAHINGAIFSFTRRFSYLLQLLKNEQASARSFKVSGHGFYYIEYGKQKALASGSYTTPKAILWQDNESAIVYLLSCQERPLFKNICEVVHEYLQPDLCKVFLRTSEIQSGLNELKRKYPQLSLRVREYTSRSLIDDPKSAKRVRTNREWTDEDYDSVFQKLEEEKQWLSSLRLEIHGQEIAAGRIWRSATFSCEAEFRLFFDTVVHTITKAVTQSTNFFNKRDRLSSPSGASRPLRIEYVEDVFGDKNQNHRLINTLKRMKDSALSVYHPNPYLHASLLDYADGSSYEVWVTKPNSILVVPQRRASTDSIERLCNFICDEFQEGVIEEVLE